MMYGVFFFFPILHRKVALIHFLLLAGGLLLHNNEKDLRICLHLFPSVLTTRGSQQPGPTGQISKTDTAVCHIDMPALNNVSDYSTENEQKVKI